MSRITEKLRFRCAVGAGSTLALVLLGGTAPLVTSASANPACGDTITSDTTLTADVGPCNDGDGLIVKNDPITLTPPKLNLNSHKVFSDAPLPRNTGVDSDGIYIPADFVGIRLDDATGAVVKNGYAKGFSAGVSIENGGSNTIRNVTARGNQAPCIGEDFSTQAVGKYGDGIVMFGSSNNNIIDSRAIDNGPFSGISVVSNVEQFVKAVPPLPTGNMVKRNLVDDNNRCFGEIGIRIEGPGATENTVASNRVTDSYLEGVAVLATNTIDFSGTTADPPTCQNRGFPDPTLPQCPLLDPLNPTNDNNHIKRNVVARNGSGGPQDPAGPGELNGPSSQSRAGIQLLSFCGYGVENGTGNTIEKNRATRSAGNGVGVGGCDSVRPSGTFPGYTNSTVTENVSSDNNQAGCGVLPPAPGCGSRPVTARYDLLDTSNVITCPSTSPDVQSRCATYGFSDPPPSPEPFLGTRVVDGGPACDSNTWSGNGYRTAFPECTTLGGFVIPPAATATARPRKRTAAAGTGDASSAQDALPPLRGPGRAGTR